MKIAFVPPWYGVNIPGGAEAEVRRTVEHLHRAGLPVEVLTTCVHAFASDWNKNYHHPGQTVENGVLVRRFPVRRRAAAAFDAVNARLMHDLPITAAEETTYVAESVRSPALENFISRHAKEYLFVFIPYMFGTTYWGIRACQGRSLLIPCLHDESYARLKVFREMFGQVRQFLFHSQSELILARSLYELDESRCALVGEGVDTEWVGDAAAFRTKYQLPRPFILYAGRKDHGKNIDLLITYFRRYREHRLDAPDLVLLGGGELPISLQPDEGIHDLGFVPLQDKYNAYAAALLLCQPSLQESFSLVLMESWVAGAPALVHGQCAVTKEHCVRSNGGLYFENYGEFELGLDVLSYQPVLREKLGWNGRRYVMENYHWDSIVERYRTLFQSLEIQ